MNINHLVLFCLVLFAADVEAKPKRKPHKALKPQEEVPKAFTYPELNGISHDQNFVMVCGEGNQLGGQLMTFASALGYAWGNGLSPVFPKQMLLNLPNGELNYKYIFHRLPQEFPDSVSTDSPTHYYFYPSPTPFAYPGGNVCICTQPSYPLNFFHPFRDKIRELYGPTEEIIETLREKYASIIDHPKTVAVHIRTYHPSYDLHLCLGVKYYENVMEQFSNDHLFVIFSDRIDWCKEHLNIQNKKAVFIEGNCHVFDLYLMSLCKNIITSNSTFSFWAAYLKKHEEGLIFAPSQWFPSYPKGDPDYFRKLYPPHFKIVPVEGIPSPDWNLVNYKSTSIYE